jgi:hypothetical protein
MKSKLTLYFLIPEIKADLDFAGRAQARVRVRGDSCVEGSPCVWGYYLTHVISLKGLLYCSFKLY